MRVKTGNQGRRKVNYNLSFQERAKRGIEKLSRQLPASLEEKGKQFQWLKENSAAKIKKQSTKSDLSKESI